MNDLVPVTTWSCKRQHSARPSELPLSEYGLAGRVGYTLCDPSGRLNVGYDQDAVDDMPRRYGFERKTPVVITDLPLCKRCERAAERASEVSS